MKRAQLYRTTVVVFLLTVCIAPIAHAEPEDSKRSLEKVLAPAIKAHRGEVAVAVKHLTTGETFEHNAETPMPTASLIKFPIMVAAYDAVEKGKLKLDELIELKEEDKVPGSGILTAHFSPGAKISLRDAIHLMMVYSDNTATNLVLDKLGIPTTNELLDSLEMPETRIHSKVFRRDTSINAERSRKFGLGSTTARDMIKLAELVYAKKLVSEEASQKMLDHLFACDDKKKVPRLLPAGTRVAHKTGSVNLVRTDAGIMETPDGQIAFAILTNNNEDQRWTDDNEGDMLCAQLGLAIYQYFNVEGSVPAAPIARTLQVGSQGELVVALQRTLNARITPSAGIGVDGDFGPETEGAVKKFQEQEGLAATGIVDANTWKALGPLIMEVEPAPEPAVVNAEPTKKSPPDPLDGAPFVTCKAWAILDGASGEFLAGDNHDEQRDPASTTKIMTAFLVISLAAEDSSVLDEVVTFSERADKTPGSTSEVKAGEQVAVRDLLYGLMLPSGNDASVALAEHFGERFAKRENGDKEKDDENEIGGNKSDETFNPYNAFIQAMNDKAKELGMTSTSFENPHGLPGRGHRTTAQDLAKLAYAAYQQPLFRQLVSTPQYGATLGSVSGYQRNIVWKNTNQLLSTDGYDGIKTGTTGAAGSCLVSSGQRGDRRLIVSVLGSTSSDARYTDTRNLYRWAWKDLLKLDPNGTPDTTISQAE